MDRSFAIGSGVDGVDVIPGVLQLAEICDGLETLPGLLVTAGGARSNQREIVAIYVKARPVRAHPEFIWNGFEITEPGGRRRGLGWLSPHTNETEPEE